MTKSRHRKSRWLDPILIPGAVQQTQHKFHPLYAFGFDGLSERRAQVACVDLHVIVYGLGGNVVFHNISADKEMKFFSSSVSVEAVLWVEASPGGTLVAACEKLKTGHCQISVIDVKKLEAVNTFSTYGHGEFGACAFSSNERQFLAACNVEHASQLDFWDVRDGRILLTTTVPYEVTKITFNPLNDEEFAVSGPLYFKFWSIKGGLKKEIHVQGLYDQNDKTMEVPTVTYTDHVWLVDTSVAVSSANGKIFIIRNYSVQHVVTDTGNTLCLLHTHRGFLAGKRDGSLVEYLGFDLYKVKIAEKEKQDPYAEVRPAVLLSGLAPIASMVMPPNGEQIIYMVEGDKIVKVPLGIGDDEDALLGTDNSARIAPLSAFRMGKISGLDVCSQRMLLVTCGSDCFLRVWSYQRMLCEICHICDEEPFLVTISPAGHYLWVAMARRIQIFRIVGYKLQHCKDIGGVKNIKQLKFSPSGHMVAAANSREIIIICAFTWKIKATLKGHTGGVTAIAWSPDSIYLMSAGLDGAIYGWFLDGFHRYLEYVVKGCIYSCLVVDTQRTFILACGPGFPLRVIDTDKKLISHGKEFSVMAEEFASTQESKEVLEGGTATNPPSPESGHSPRSSASPTSEDPVSQPSPSIKRDSVREGPPGSPSSLGSPGSPGTPPPPPPPPPHGSKKRDSTMGTEEHPEGSWVQHKYRSNCMFELTHEKPVTLMAGLFKTGVLVTTAPGGELRMYSYPFARDSPNLLKEVHLLTTGDITGLCLDEDRRLIFACTTQGSIFISTIDVEVVGPKVEDPYEDEMMEIQEVIPVIPGIMQYLQDTGTDALNILLQRDEVEEMKRDLEELKLTMAREVKDASFRAQRAALEWATGMKEREAGYLEKVKEYEVQVKLLSHNLHLAISDKETAIQELLETQRCTTLQLEDFYQNKLAQELERSHISRKQFQKDLMNLENEMKDKEQIYLEKMVALEKELEGADAAAQEAIKKVRDECEQVNQNCKMEMEEDLLLSDEELNKALEKLNADVNVEKERADENFEQLLIQKRHVMKADKKMKDMQAVHTEHVELIDKLKSENTELKKTVMELDYEKRILKKVVTLTDEKTQHLVHERKDQETKTIVRDFKIQQLRKREQPLEREAAQLRFQLREMEKHQLSHVLEMKHQTLIVDNLKSRIAVLEEDSQKVADQLHERETYVDMFTRALCQLVQEHDVSEWPSLIKQLYYTYVKDYDRTETLDHLDAFGEVMHQRENLEKFVAILQREIGRSEVRNWRETQKFMQQNLEMLHEYNEGQRNTRRLAFMTQKLQGDVTYWKAVAAKPERRLKGTFENLSPSKTSPLLDNQSASISRNQSRCSKSTRKSTPCNKLRASLVSSAELSRASSPGMNDEALSAEEERSREQFRSSTPVAHILKPYLHRGTIASAATSRYSFIQNRPWSPEPQSDKDRAVILDLNVLVGDMRKELKKKDEIIQQLQKASRLSKTSNYLAGTQSQSLLETAADEGRVKLPGVQFSVFEDMEPIEETGSRRPKSVPNVRTGNYQITRKKSQSNLKINDNSNVQRDFSNTSDLMIPGEKQDGSSWVPKSADALDFKPSSNIEKPETARISPTLLGRRASSPTALIPLGRRASSPTGLSTITFDGDSVRLVATDAPTPPGRRASSPTALIPLGRRASSPTGLSTITIDGGSVRPIATDAASRRRSLSPPGQNYPKIDVSLLDRNSPPPVAESSSLPGMQPASINVAQRTGSSPVVQQQGSDPTTASPELNLLQRSSSPDPRTNAHPRILVLQQENSALAVEQLTGVVEALPTASTSPPRRRSLSSPPLAGLSTPTLQFEQPAAFTNDSGPEGSVHPQPVDPLTPLASSTSAPVGRTTASGAGHLPVPHDPAPIIPFLRRKSTLMKVEIAESVSTIPPRGEGPEPLPRRKSTFAKAEAGPDNPITERTSSTFVPPGLNTQRRKSSRFETTFLGSQVTPNISELHPPSSINPPTRKQSITPQPGGANYSRRASSIKVDGNASSSRSQTATNPANIRRRPSSMKLESSGRQPTIAAATSAGQMDAQAEETSPAEIATPGGAATKDPTPNVPPRNDDKTNSETSTTSEQAD